MNYGLPYQGSKSRIADWVMTFLPPADTFVDLFFGGGAMTHCAMRHHKFRHYIANDILPGNTKLFKDAVEGKYREEKRWISREDFFALKDTDPYVAFCWSFGNNRKDYLYRRELEPYKKACHYAVVFDDWDLMAKLCPETWQAARKALAGIAGSERRRKAFGPAIVRELKAIGDISVVNGNPLYSSCHKRQGRNGGGGQSLRDLESLESLASLASLESLERLQRLQSLEVLQRLDSIYRLQASSVSYEQVLIPRGSVVYADPPYRDMGKYADEKGKFSTFNHERFYDWLRSVDFCVWVSEYQMPDDFVCIGENVRPCSFSATATSVVTERIFVHKRWADKIFKPSLF